MAVSVVENIRNNKEIIDKYRYVPIHTAHSLRVACSRYARTAHSYIKPTSVLGIIQYWDRSACTHWFWTSMADRRDMSDRTSAFSPVWMYGIFLPSPCRRCTLGHTARSFHGCTAGVLRIFFPHSTALRRRCTPFPQRTAFTLFCRPASLLVSTPVPHLRGCRSRYAAHTLPNAPRVSLTWTWHLLPRGNTCARIGFCTPPFWFAVPHRARSTAPRLHAWTTT